jgi:hypothetical protein
MAGRSKKLLESGARIPEPDPEKDTLEHYERFAWTLRIPDTGERLKLQEWQLGPLEDWFAKKPESRDPSYFIHLWEWPTGQGKSAIFGSLALHHGTYVAARPRVFVVGGELEHARNTTDAASGFILESRKSNGLLGQWWEPQEFRGGRIVPLWLDDPDVGIFARSAGRQVEAKGGSSVEGKRPTLILVEELHRHADQGAAVNTLITKTIKSGATGIAVRVGICTTAGTNRNSHLGRMEKQLLDEEAGATVQKDLRPGEYYTRAVSADEDNVGHIWAVPEHISPPRGNHSTEEDLEDFLGHVKRANPASWITVLGLKRVYKSLSRIGRWMFLRQNANQWVTAGFGVLDRGHWWRLRKPGAKIPAGKHIVVVGLDRASKWDSTVIAPVWLNPETNKLRAAGAVVLESPRDGTRRRTSDVGKILEAMRERWPNMVVAFDRAQGGGDVAEELEEKHGITIVDHGQGVDFDLASMRLGEVVDENRLEWDASDKYREQFALQVLNAVVVPTSGGKRWRGEAPDDETPADAFDALAMAVHVATSDEFKKPKINPDNYRISTV